MLFITVEDFFRKAAGAPLSREAECRLAEKMHHGDPTAKEAILQGYLPHAAAVIGRMPPEYQTLELVMRCCTAPEKAVDRFDFSQSGEIFPHRLSWVLRQTTAAYIADKRA